MGTRAVVQPPARWSLFHIHNLEVLRSLVPLQNDGGTRFRKILYPHPFTLYVLQNSSSEIRITSMRFVSGVKVPSSASQPIC